VFGRADSIDGLGPAASVDQVFSAPVGGVVGPLLVQSRNVVAKVTEKSEADLTSLPVEHDTLMQQLKQKKAQERASLLMDGILAKLTSEGKVTVHSKEIQSMVASLRQQK
jgi:parvulin-like peptidyl-prolyl isomerase